MTKLIKGVNGAVFEIDDDGEVPSGSEIVAAKDVVKGKSGKYTRYTLKASEPAAEPEAKD